MMTASPPRFVHLHLHTHYSQLDATIRIPELMDQILEEGMDAVAITDHGNLHGAFQFFKAAKKKKVHPIIGCEVYVAPGDHKERKKIPGRKAADHLVLLAENQRGYHNLVQLVSRAYMEGFYYHPRISKDLLSTYSEGLIGLSACLSGEIPRLLMDRDTPKARNCAEEYREILGKDNFFLEIQNHGLADEAFVRQGLEDISRMTGIPLLATNDCHIHRPEDLFAQRVAIGIGRGKTLEQLHRDFSYSEAFAIRSPEEMHRLFADYPGACDRSVEIASRCSVDFETEVYHLPRYPVPADEDLESYLRKIATKGLEEKLRRQGQRNHPREDYFHRLDHELGIINTMGFPGYFLVVWDFVRHAKENDIPVGPGRGSAAGSVVSWALDITDVDPLEYDLLFERFLNPFRISMPDIDIDFCQRKRDRIIEYVRNLYGPDSVAQIATFNVLKAKSAIRDVGRVMDISLDDVNRIAKLIPDDVGITMEGALKESRELRDLYEGDDVVHQLVDTATRLEGLTRHTGVHAAGVVIAPEPLANLVPVFSSSTDDVCTQFDKDDIEELGLLKMDFLGLRTLTVISDAVESIHRETDPSLDLQQIPLDDPEVYKLFSSGDTDGVFQFESSGMKEALRKVQPRVFNDLAALNALYRPGPMAFIEDYTARKHGKKKIRYIFPELEEILGESHGIIVFQEQVMRIAQAIAGFSLAEADVLRKAMGKKKQEIIDEQGGIFIKGAVAKGFPESKVRTLWDQIIPFARYGFNKSHSVAYAQVAYLTAYLKVHFPVHFMAAMLTSEMNNTDKLSQYLGRTRQMGIEILPPDINNSTSIFVAEGGQIRFGLAAIKNVGSSAVGPIIKAREREGGFKSISHCFRSLPQRSVNTKVLEALVQAGAFDSLGVHRKALLDRLDQMVELCNRERIQEELQQGYLFAQLPSEELEEELRKIGIGDDETRLEWEHKVLGFYLTGHPLHRWEKQLEIFADCRIEDLPEKFSKGAEEVSVGGLIGALRIIPIKKEGRNKGRKMADFRLEGLEGSVRVVTFPDAYDQYHSLLQEDRPVLVKAQLKGDGDHVELILESVIPLEILEKSRASALSIQLNLGGLNEELLSDLRELLLTHSGDTAVRLDLLKPGGFRARLTPPPALSVEATPELRNMIEELIPGARTHFEYLGPARQ